MTRIIPFVLIVLAHAKVSGMLDPKRMPAALQIKLVRLSSCQRRDEAHCVFRHDLFLQTFVHVHFMRAAFAKSPLVLTGGAFVRAKHSLSSAISVSQ